MNSKCKGPEVETNVGVQGLNGTGEGSRGDEAVEEAGLGNAGPW